MINLTKRLLLTNTSRLNASVLKNRSTAVFIRTNPFVNIGPNRTFFSRVGQAQPQYNYKGDLKNGMRHGQGRIEFADGMVWDGIFSDGQFVRGCCHFPDGRVYEGDLKDEKFHGHGQFSAPDGTLIYIGSFCQGVRAGEGTMYKTDGSLYFEGTWLENVPHGRGTFYGPDEKILYKGDVARGLYEGEGTLFRPNGS